MRYLFDSNAISDFMSNNVQFSARVKKLTPADHVITTTTIVRGEALFGLHRMPEGRRKEEVAAGVQRAFAFVPCVDLPVSAADRYAVLKIDCQRRGRPVDENDLRIAAAALELNATVVTRDSDLKSIPSLNFEDWTL